MPGICALIHSDESPPSRAEMAALCAAGEHRGAGSWTQDEIPGGAFAYRALGGGQPRIRSGGPARYRDQILLVADVRLDDRHRFVGELRREGLEVSEGATDAELLLAAYRAWGEGCAARLRGDFALVVWDRSHRRVYCARDVFGIKPLHYHLGGHRFRAASEAQQIALHSDLDKGLDEVAVADYLLDQSWDESRTFFDGVRSLPSGSYLVAEGGRSRVERYWRPETDLFAGSSKQEIEEETLRRLEMAVARRLDDAGDVAGIAMSGGLDSCSLAAVGHRQAASTGRRLQAYSYDFTWLPDCDESLYTEAVAAELGLPVEPVDTRLHWLLGDDAAFEPELESPFQGWQSTDRQMFEGLRRRGGRVLLTGLGGDNLFAGSRRVFLSQLLRGRISGATGLIRHARSQRLGILRALHHFLLAPVWPRADRGIRRLLGREAPNQLPPWIPPCFAERTGLRRRLLDRTELRLFRDPARQAHWSVISCLESVGRAVSWLDRVGGRHGVEVRHPFLDRDLAELVLALPPEEHFRPGESKSLLRRSMAGRLPEVVRRRPDKTRFGPFIDYSLRLKEFQRVTGLLEAPRMADLGFVDPQALRATWEDYRQGRSTAPVPSLWYPITLELWLRRIMATRQVSVSGSKHLMALGASCDRRIDNLVS